MRKLITLIILVTFAFAMIPCEKHLSKGLDDLKTSNEASTVKSGNAFANRASANFKAYEICQNTNKDNLNDILKEIKNIKDILVVIKYSTENSEID